MLLLDFLRWLFRKPEKTARRGSWSDVKRGVRERQRNERNL